jgi:hypothetical protein
MASSGHTQAGEQWYLSKKAIFHNRDGQTQDRESRAVKHDDEVVLDKSLATDMGTGQVICDGYSKLYNSSLNSH